MGWLGSETRLQTTACNFLGRAPMRLYLDTWHLRLILNNLSGYGHTMLETQLICYLQSVVCSLKSICVHHYDNIS